MNRTTAEERADFKERATEHLLGAEASRRFVLKILADFEDLQRDNAALVKQRDELLKRVEWQDISTAPKNETQILVYIPEHDNAVDVYLTTQWCPEEDWWLGVITDDGDKVYPTHWKSITPPQADAAQLEKEVE